MEPQSSKNLSGAFLYRASLALFLGGLLFQVVAWRVQSGAALTTSNRWIAVFFACTGVLLTGWLLALIAAPRSVAARWLLFLETPFLLYGLYMCGLFVYSMLGGRV